MTISAKIIADSVAPDGTRLTTYVLRYHRYVHAELMTHRMFCLDGDSMLEFDLPGGSLKGSSRRPHKMTLKQFVTKWKAGVARHRASMFTKVPLSIPEDATKYTAKQLASLLHFKSASNIRCACRNGDLQFENTNKKRNDDYIILGSSYIAYRKRMGTRSFSIQSRLQDMRIRQLNESTGEIQTSFVTDCCESGIKDVYELKAGKFKVSASADHMLLTDSGWKQMRDIIPAQDKVIVQTFGKVEEEKLDSTRLKKINGKWRSTWQNQIRPEIAKRQKGKCFECSKPLGTSFDLHHIVPVYRNPALAFEVRNVHALHKKCRTVQHTSQDWQGGTYLYGKPMLVDSITFKGKKQTYDLSIAGEFPNFLANDIVVHNSRNASSSRAIPVEKMIAWTKEDPAMPVEWGVNQRGMQANELLSPEKVTQGELIWLKGRDAVIKCTEELIELGVHKQIANRMLEPWHHIAVVLSATQYANWFALRHHSAAQPEIRELAKAMWREYKTSKPVSLQPGEWHLPFIREDEQAVYSLEERIKASVARCARVSYMNHDGSTPNMAKDIALHDMLAVAVPLHASPCEHQATPLLPSESPALSGNFSKGWKQYRKMLPNECVETMPDLP